MPLFALANSGVELRAAAGADLLGPVALGTGLALVLGKQAGIFAFAAGAVRLGLAPIPGRASFAKLLGVSTVAGIGFTVALFIAGLAFADDPGLLAQAKIGILAGSLAAGVMGALVLLATPEVKPAGAPARTSAPADAAGID
jgi:NhaA family Na+:H+ antiporter